MMLTVRQMQTMRIHVVSLVFLDYRNPDSKIAQYRGLERA